LIILSIILTSMVTLTYATTDYKDDAKYDIEGANIKDFGENCDNLETKKEEMLKILNKWAYLSQEQPFINNNGEHKDLPYRPDGETSWDFEFTSATDLDRKLRLNDGKGTILDNFTVYKGWAVFMKFCTKSEGECNNKRNKNGGRIDYSINVTTHGNLLNRLANLNNIKKVTTKIAVSKDQDVLNYKETAKKLLVECSYDLSEKFESWDKLKKDNDRYNKNIEDYKVKEAKAKDKEKAQNDLIQTKQAAIENIETDIRFWDSYNITDSSNWEETLNNKIYDLENEIKRNKTAIKKYETEIGAYVAEIKLYDNQLGKCDKLALALEGETSTLTDNKSELKAKIGKNIEDTKKANKNKTDLNSEIEGSKGTLGYYKEELEEIKMRIAAEEAKIKRDECKLKKNAKKLEKLQIEKKRQDQELSRLQTAEDSLIGRKKLNENLINKNNSKKRETSTNKSDRENKVKVALGNIKTNNELIKSKKMLAQSQAKNKKIETGSKLWRQKYAESKNKENLENELKDLEEKSDSASKKLKDEQSKLKTEEEKTAGGAFTDKKKKCEGYLDDYKIRFEKVRTYKGVESSLYHDFNAILKNNQISGLIRKICQLKDSFLLDYYYVKTDGAKFSPKITGEIERKRNSNRDINSQDNHMSSAKKKMKRRLI